MSTVKTTYDDRALAGEPIARDQARALLGQVMGLVAVAVGFAALGAYLGRDLSGATGLVLFIGAFACIFALNAAAAKRPRATRDRTAVRAGPAARTRGRPRHRRLRQDRPVRAVAGGRSDRGVRRRLRRLRLRHAPRPLLVGAHAVLGAAGPDRVRDRRDLRLDPQQPHHLRRRRTRDLRCVHDLRLQPPAPREPRRRRRRSPPASSSTSSTSSCCCSSSSAASGTNDLGGPSVHHPPHPQRPVGARPRARLAELRAAHGRGAARARRPRRHLDVLMRQLAADPAVRQGVGRALSRPRARRRRRALPRVRVRARPRQRASGDPRAGRRLPGRHRQRLRHLAVARRTGTGPPSTSSIATAGSASTTSARATTRRPSERSSSCWASTRKPSASTPAGSPRPPTGTP